MANNTDGEIFTIMCRPKNDLCTMNIYGTGAIRMTINAIPYPNGNVSTMVFKRSCHILGNI